MKKYILLLLFSLSVIITHAQNIQNSVYLTWNKTSSAWDSTYRYYYSYLAGNTNMEVQTQNYKDNIWSNSYKYNTFYNKDFNSHDKDLRTDSVIYSVWYNNAWILYVGQQVFYTSNNVLSSSFVYSNTGTSILTVQTIKGYSNNDGKLIAISQKSLNSDKVLENSDSIKYSYNSNGDVNTVESCKWNSTNKVWEKKTNILYTYNDKHVMQEQIQQNYNTGTSAYMNYLRYTYTYDANNKQTDVKLEIWNTDSKTWVNYSHSSSSYNAAGINYMDVSYVWDNASNKWIDYSRNTTFYKSSGKADYYLTETFDTSLGIYVNTSKIVYDVGVLITSTDNSSDLESELTLYPNPAVDRATINFMLRENQKVSVSLYNQRGALVKELNGEFLAAGRNSLTFDLSDIPQGIYFTRIKTTSGIATQKLIVTK